MKYKNAAMSLLFLLGAVASVLFISVPKAQAAGTCYTSTGVLKVSASTINCPSSAGSGGRVSYFNIDKVQIPEAQDGRCYGSESSGSGAFASTRYTEYSCADLEILRANALKEACEATGGDWDVSYQGGSQLTSRCICLSDTVANPANGRCEVRGADDGGDDVPNGGGLVVEGEGNKILDLIQDGINLMTALAGLAITAMVIVGGIQYSTAGGNPQAAGAAKKKITNAFIALVTLVFIFTFLQWLVPGGIFG